MTEEAYVSFETAKILFSKGFVDQTRFRYNKDGQCVWNDDERIGFPGYYPCPTQSVCLRWLRESHNLCIEPYRTACGYLYTISKIPTGTELYSDEYKGDDEYSGQWTTWEKAIDAGIEYCLKNLIKEE